MIVLTGAVACQPAITILPPAADNSPLPAATVAPSERGLAVIAVDFDPALEYSQLLSNGGVSLLVAVENQGRRTESNVLVTAELREPDGRGADLLRETVRVRSISPGAVEVVRFSQVTDLPVRPSYELVVAVAPAPGETDLEDNTRRYDIIVEDGR